MRRDDLLSEAPDLSNWFRPRLREERGCESVAFNVQLCIGNVDVKASRYAHDKVRVDQ